MAGKKHREKPRLLIVLEYIPFWIMFRTVRLLSLKTAYFISSQVFLLVFLLDLRHRRRTISHLLHAGVASSREEAVGMARKVYINLSRTLAEVFKIDQIIDFRKIKIVGCEETIREINDGGTNRNFIIVTAHYGNWEVSGRIWAEMAGIPIVSVMRKFSNPLIGRLVVSLRESGVHHCVEKDGSIKVLLKALRNGHNVGVLADQHANSHDGVETVFFGQPCRTHGSPALLHLKTGVPILPAVARRNSGDFSFDLVMGPLIRYQPTGDKDADIKAVAQMFTSELEALIRPEPEQWLWAHRRWLNINRKSSSGYQPSAEQSFS